MFFNLVKNNSKRNRNENGLFFTSLIVSIVAFYIILSLGNQDVIIFLKTMESDAVSQLLLLMPVLYAVSLFILFFLVYFAGKYQLERRSHELGMYLMLGMRRSKLFSMLLTEELWNSIISVAIGIPVAIFISEVISMITAKAVGLGLIGHSSSFSIGAVIFTFVGYFVIRLAALLILSGIFAKKELRELLSESQEKKNKTPNRVLVSIKLIFGSVLLVVAYGLAITGNAWNSIEGMGSTVVLGLCGTFLFFNGIGVLFETFLSRMKKKNGLAVFTFRQLQENVFLKSNSLAISSLLVLMALCCFGYGVSVSFNAGSKDKNVVHYTFHTYDGDEKDIEEELKISGITEYMEEVFLVKLGSLRDDENSFSVASLIEAVEMQPSSRDKDILINNLKYFDYPYLISVSGYNRILTLAGKEPIKLKENEVALYNGLDFSYGKTADILSSVLKDKISVEINGKEFQLKEQLFQNKFITDRSINFSYALIVSDEFMEQYGDKKYNGDFWNGILKEDFVKNKGLMQGIMEVNELLNKMVLSSEEQNITPLRYESYLQNMGRQLFYSVAGSYTTIYLGIIFLVIANTVIGVQFLMQQQKTGRRYGTLIRLGCEYKELCKSARNQIKWYFSLPVVIAAIGSIFGVTSLFVGISTTQMKTQLGTLILLSIPIILVLCVVEFCYIIAVMRSSDKQIRGLMDVKREDN